MIRMLLTLLLAAAMPLAAQGVEGGRNPADTGEVPADHRPPPGMCRIWIDGVPAARQPAPTDCSTAIRRRPPNARVVFGKELRDGDRAPVRIPGALPLVNKRGKASDSEREPAGRRDGDTPPDPRPVRTRDTAAPAPATRRDPAARQPAARRPEPGSPERRPEARSAQPRTRQPRAATPRPHRPQPAARSSRIQP